MAARLYLTANCAFWMGILGGSQNNVDAASGYLRSYLDENGTFPSYMHTHWLAAGFWLCQGENDAAELVITHLLRHLSDMPASSLAWMLNAVCICSPQTQPALVNNTARNLAEMQQPDGRWRSEEGPAFDVHTTLEALRGLQFAGY
jgi:hypothetical protein